MSMFEIDKEKFGIFVCERRKEKKMTQKELAEKLYVSDKAVSKWERGLSMPDISLLIPMSEVLEVTVTELLEGKKMEKSEQLSTEQVEALMQKALCLSDEEPPLAKQNKRKRGFLLLGAILIALFEGVLVVTLGRIPIDILFESISLGEGLSIIFGFYFGCVLSDRLPKYYDEYPISVYTQKGFELHLPGVYFNNHNWPYMLKVGFYWSLVNILFTPLLFMIFAVVQLNSAFILTMIVSGVSILGLFIPFYYVGLKYSK